MSSTSSLAESLASLNAEERAEALAGLTQEQAEELLYDWRFWARPSQLAPDWLWLVWLIEAGRGWGKTRVGAQWVIAKAKAMPWSRGFLAGRTSGDVRDTMIEGESGIIACSPPWFKPMYLASRRRLVWPNGARATTFSGEEPDQARGPQHHWGWADELAAWKYEDAWDQLMFGLRLDYTDENGKTHQPQCAITTTPKRRKFIRELKKERTTALTKGTSYENQSNLSAAFFSKVIRRYEGTTLGRQELEGQDIEDTPGALWTSALIDATRVRVAPELMRTVVAIDPSVTAGKDSDEAGIVVAGVAAAPNPKDRQRHGYVLDDLSDVLTPTEWATRAVKAYAARQADRIVAEVNNGGDMVELTVRTVEATVSYRGVHAAKGKRTRAEPVSALYEKGLVHHVGTHAKLEDEMTTWVPGEKSPNRMDALVWALTDLMLAGHVTTTSTNNQSNEQESPWSE